MERGASWTRGVLNYQNVLYTCVHVFPRADGVTVSGDSGAELRAREPMAVEPVEAGAKQTVNGERTADGRARGQRRGLRGVRSRWAMENAGT